MVATAALNWQAESLFTGMCASVTIGRAPALGRPVGACAQLGTPSFAASSILGPGCFSQIHQNFVGVNSNSLGDIEELDHIEPPLVTLSVLTSFASSVWQVGINSLIPPTDPVSGL